MRTRRPDARQWPSGTRTRTVSAAHWKPNDLAMAEDLRQVSRGLQCSHHESPAVEERRPGARSRRRARTRAGAFVFTLLLTAAAAPAQIISGTVFEDFNYGGGAGRDRASAAGSDRPTARVELYDGAGAFQTSTVTDALGNYAFRLSGGRRLHRARGQLDGDLVTRGLPRRPVAGPDLPDRRRLRRRAAGHRPGGRRDPRPRRRRRRLHHPRLPHHRHHHRPECHPRDARRRSTSPAWTSASRSTWWSASVTPARARCASS